MRTARHMIMELAEVGKQGAAPAPDFSEVGNRGDDLDVASDGRLRNEDDITLDTYRKMRKDPQIKACLLILKLPILQVDWTIQADTEDGKKLAKWIEQRLYDMDDSPQYYIREMLTALDFGYSVTEKIWQLKTVPVDPDGNGNRMEQMIVPLKLRTYDPRSMSFKLDPVTYKLLGALQKQKQGADLEIPADKLMIYSHEKEFGDYNGEAALRAAYKPWIIKEFLQKFWNIALERFGTPFMSMNVPQGGSLTAALTLMDQIKGKTGIPLPDGYELELHALANTGMSFKDAIDYQDTQIARSMLIPDLVFGKGEGGAYALSKTHATMFLLRLNGITQDVGDILTSYLVKPMVRYNFGEVAEFPAFKFSDVADDDLTTLITIVTQLITGKVIAPSEEWIRERFGIPAADDKAQEFLDKQREVVMSGMENLNKANNVRQNVDGKTDPTGGEPVDPNAGDPEGDKKKQKQIQNNSEDDDLDGVDYLAEIRSGVRGILKLGLGADANG